MKKMKANELRTGNKIISCFNRIETVKSIIEHDNNEEYHEIYKHLICVKEFGNQYNLAEIKPIPLTEQRLIDLWFETDHYTFWKNGNKKIQIGFFKDGFFLIWKGSLQDRFGKKLEYVHQIQNVWFELTGEELTGEELTIKENGTYNM